MILFYVNAYRCRLAAFQIMGNHFHLVVHFEKPRPLSRRELMESAHKLYGREAEDKTAAWTDDKWKEFNERLFDLSKLMANVGGFYALWFNGTFGRRGHLWGDRFKSSELLGLEAVQDAVLYVELNAVRAGIVKRPEEWKWGSALWRLTGQDQDLIPLEELFPRIPDRTCTAVTGHACTIEEPFPRGTTRRRSPTGSCTRSGAGALRVPELFAGVCVS